MSKRRQEPPCYRVSVVGEWPKKRRRLLPNRFEKRQQARQFCRNHRIEFEKMIIIHPDGSQEVFVWDGD